MSLPVKLSDELVLEARLAAKEQERSIAGQVEFWAKLGQATELLLDGRRVNALRTHAKSESVSEALGLIDTPIGRKRLHEVLQSRPFPHFEQHPEDASLLVRIEEDGSRRVGRFVNREFVDVSPRSVISRERTLVAKDLGRQRRHS